jgi:exonuclease III
MQTCNDIPAEAKRKPKRDGNRTIKRQRRQKTYNIATWNVRSMYVGKLNIVKREMNCMDIDILGISEMKWIGSGHFRSANNTVMYSGHNMHRKNGMGMIIVNRVSKSLIRYKAVNDRIIYIRVRAHPVNITFVQVYAPTTSAEAADIEDFYNDLQVALNETLKRDVLIIMGDWNAKIGKGEEPGTVGRHGLGNRNEAGERLLEFCEEKALFLANNYFELPERRLYTWTPPDGKHKNQIDYILGRRRRRSALQSVKTKPNAICGSDHELLTATITIKLKRTQQAKKGRKLDVDNIPEEYKSEIKQLTTAVYA